MAILAITQPDGRVEPHPLGPGRFTIGRAPGNSLALDSPFLSRQHAVLIPQASGYAIQDLGSKNGVWVNGLRLGSAPHRLANGDLIVLGNRRVELRFYLDDSTMTVTTDPGLGDLDVDLRGREVTLRGQRLNPPLTRKEFDILALLWERRGAACSRDDLAARGWPERTEGEVGDAEIEQYIRRLRRRLGDGGFQPQLLVTVRGFGYKLA